MAKRKTAVTTPPATEVEHGVTEQTFTPVHNDGPFANLLDTAKFEHIYRVAKAYSQSTLVPEHFRGNPANCFIGVQMAVRCGVDPFGFLQKCYVVHGKPGIETQLAIALANSARVFRGPIRYRLSEDKTRCVAYAEDSETGEVLESAEVNMSIAKAEGWLDKAGSKWKTMPELMLCYRSAMWLLRQYKPDVLMGMYTKEELDDMVEGETVARREVQLKSTDDLKSRLMDKTEPDPSPIKEGDLMAFTRRITELEKLDAVETELAAFCIGCDDKDSILRAELLAADRCDEIRAAAGPAKQGELIQ